MRRIALVIVLIALIGCAKKPASQPAATSTTWLDRIEDAQKLASEKNLPILADFTGSDWCVWCQKLDQEVFSQQAFADYAKDHLVLLKLDFPRKVNVPPADVRNAREALSQKYNVEGFPTVLLLDATGKELARTGYRPGGAAEYVEHLKGLAGSGK
jgi:protein disulfide-isomerase